jgi:hypothetical protein
MEKIGSLFVNHFHHRISSPINNVNNIPICLCTIHHEPLENKHTQPFLFNNYIQLFPKNALSFRVLKLHVIKHNCHDLTIDRVINMIGHGRPSLNTIVEISQNVTAPFMTTCDLLFATTFGSICNYKIKFQLFWSFLQLRCNY